MTQSNIRKPKIVVVGSSNTDMVVKANRLPVPGETILGGTFLMIPGGKGANQAIAAKRLGGEVTFVSKIGMDLFGMQALEIYRSERIHTEYVFSDNRLPSGVALISVDSSGENCIIVASGANMSLSPEDIEKVKQEIIASDLILMQLEIPLDTVEYVVNLAHKHGKKVILNPAPVTSLSNELIRKLYAILPNRIEAQMLSGVTVTDLRSAHEASRIISDKGIENVVITLGKEGAYVKEKDYCLHLPALDVETLDTTGAGDVFCGAVSVYLSEGNSLMESVAFANVAASLSVTRIGAQSAIPYRREVENEYVIKNEPLI
ncbi:MAG: ribokinase [Tannerellaceae bacterium]|nr:ribokinase [Tannerellaceae bacterium]